MQLGAAARQSAAGFSQSQESLCAEATDFEKGSFLSPSVSVSVLNHGDSFKPSNGPSLTRGWSPSSPS
eukprot:2781964-Rhodomonas_salina.1